MPAPERTHPRALDHPIALQALIPFVTEPFISTTRNTRCGRGMIVPLTAAANAPVTVTHNLGRIVQGMIVLLNAAGAAFPPRLMFAPGERSATKQTIVGDADMTTCLVWLV
jgi:hypothetical protein